MSLRSSEPEAALQCPMTGGIQDILKPKVEGQEFLKRYSFNFEGNGLRYLLQELMIMIRDRRTECTRFFYEESETLAELLKIIDQRG